MLIKQLKKLVPDKPELPRCEAHRKSKYANDSDDSDLQCTRSATYRINGMNYCKPHAGDFALKLLLNSEGLDL